uniref:Uncharacterized protein n=1 Tax=Cacopsylla melanoneura TaxID=428564 RepID=A0A8D9BAS3_9HEMI
MNHVHLPSPGAQQYDPPEFFIGPCRGKSHSDGTDQTMEACVVPSWSDIIGDPRTLVPPSPTNDTMLSGGNLTRIEKRSKVMAQTAPHDRSDKPPTGGIRH